MRVRVVFTLAGVVSAIILPLVSPGVGHRTLEVLGLAQSQPVMPPAGISTASEVANVKEFGAKGDGRADDREAIARAVATLPPRGGVLFFPCGTYVTLSASALVTVTDRNGTTIEGGGASCTTLRQAGAGNGIELIGKTEITNIIVRDLTVDGSNRAAKGIDTQNLKDGLIERVTIAGFLDHAIDVRGQYNLHNIIRHSRITAGVGARATGRALNIRAGNQNASEFNYYNIGGPGRYDTVIDARGSSPFISIGDIFDGATYAIQSNGALLVLMPYFDFHSLKAGVYPHANNTTVVIGERGGGTDQIIHNPGNAVSDKYLTLIGSNDGTSGMIGGALLGAVATPQSLTANENDYAPPGSRYTLVWRLSSDAPRVVTGLANGVDGKILTISNVGAFPITLGNQSVRSAVANRIITGAGADVSIAPDGAATLYYDGASARWRVTALR